MASHAAQASTGQRSINPPHRHRLRFNAEQLRAAAVSIVLAVPMALLFVRGPVRAIGIVYALAWFLIVVPSASAHLWLIVDALLLFANRRPLLLPAAFAVAAGAHHSRPRVHGTLHLYAQVSSMCSPIANLAGAMLTQAFEWRSREVIALWAEAKEHARPPQDPQFQPTPEAEMAAPIVERARPELVCA